MIRGRVRGGVRSVRFRILAWILLVAALGMAVAGTASYLIQRERVLLQIDARLADTVDGLRFIAEGGEGDEAPATVRDFLARAMAQVLPAHNESTLGIVDGEAALVPSSGIRFRLDDDPDFVARVVAEADGDEVVRGTASTDDGTLRYVAIPVAIQDDDARGLYVSAYDLDAELAEITESFAIFTLLAVLTLVLVGAVGWYVGGRLLRPIRSLQATAARISDTDLSKRIDVVGHDDVSELARTVNAMLDRLERSFSDQRRLIDDVGHELRTPLTIVRGHLEMLERDPGRDVDETRRLAIEEVDRMSELVQDIALLAKSGTPGFLRLADVELADFTADVAAKARMLSDAHDWRVAETAHGVVLLDRARLTQAWLQLAENAAKYSPPGEILLVSRLLPRELELAVEDRGPGIPDEQLERVFERFARAHVGRGDDGSGLGLSIVAAIATAHGGSARAEPRDGGGVRVAITVPVRRAWWNQPAEGRPHAAHPAG
jgi:two-component system, OmpR family, sensor kinase